MSIPSINQKAHRLGAGALSAMIGKELDRLKQIAAGWRYTLFPDWKIEQLARERALVCGTCEHSTGSKCSLCGCPLQAKMRSPNAVCPDGRWTR